MLKFRKTLRLGVFGHVLAILLAVLLLVSGASEVAARGFQGADHTAEATVRYIPSGATKVVIDRVTYYQTDSTWYKRYFDENGEVSYMVVEDPT